MVLELEEDYAFQAYGIVSTSKGHRLCWAINKALNINLKRDKDIEIISKAKTSRHHAIYNFFDENLHIKYRLIENKKGVSMFLPEVKNADYLIVIDSSEEVDKEQITLKLRSIKAVLLAFHINLDEITSKQNILLAA
ncbi:MAG: IPExxxVDY family protein [Flavobacteriales bacterium]|nr:IPExxxVDY family protein [Flavobacteriales bacterium]